MSTAPNLIAHRLAAHLSPDPSPASATGLSHWLLFRLLACLAIVIVPHFQRLPVWACVLVTTVLIWRGLAALRHWPLPPAWLRAVLAFAAFLGLFLSYGRINSSEAGAGLLVVMVALKLTEMGRLRDCAVVLMLAYFILVTHFLASQEIGTVVYVFGSALLVTVLLVEVSHPQGPLPTRVSLRGGAALLLQAVPLMLLMFVLFPRIPGPLWGIPTSEKAGRTGLSGSMEPGTISRVSRSDEPAFRVTFLDPPPPPNQRYWRGPVFWLYDGRSWTEGAGFRGSSRAIEPIGLGIRHEVMLEAHGEFWLLALDLPVQGPSGSVHNSAHQLMNARRVRERLLYQAVSYPRYRLQAELPDTLRQRALQIPRHGNPRLRALAEEWRRQAPDDRAVITTALDMFREQAFFYTLSPPLLSQASSMDDFLFNTRRGFCEHYASAFTLLMRAAGIPARVVTGYQGGELSAAGGHFIVRQSDAHAWSEVWLAGEGWVRIDPTAAVAPQRIESGLAASLPEDEAALVRHDSEIYWVYRLEDYWEWVNLVWNRSVLAYGPELQQQFLRRFGIRDWYRMTLVLTALVVGFLVLLGAVLLWQARQRGIDDPALREWVRTCRALARRRLPRLPHEGPRDYAERIGRERPDLADDMARISGLYIGLRYAGVDDVAALRQLRDQVRRFKP
jgi:protein-glutamine gamma-glutamyltransferase